MKMELDLAGLGETGLTAEAVTGRLEWMREVVRPRLGRYLGYYRNASSELARYLACGLGASLVVRPYRQYQEMGLPARITGFRHNAAGVPTVNGRVDLQRKEVVIENDIGWRVNTLVDFVAGRLQAIVSTARDERVRGKVTRWVKELLASAGGVGLLQEIALQGAIYGSAWLRIEPTEELLGRLNGKAGGGDGELGDGVRGDGGQGEAGGAKSAASDAEAWAEASEGGLTRWVRVKVIETPRLCPLVAGEKCVAAAVLREDEGSGVEGAAKSGLMERVSRFFRGDGLSATKSVPPSFDLFGAEHWQRYVRGELAEEGRHGLGCVPFVRYENQRDPAGEMGGVGLGEVEPLMALQDELNTRLSDRAYRVTMTSFQMYLGKGIENFTERPVGPGQMWATDNPEASITAFGDDGVMPSEDAHIGEIRDGLDKVSGVSPVAAGLIRGKLGNLTSAVALRITLIALLARTERKRSGLAETLSTLVEKVLEILDRAGVMKTGVEDRGIDINWPTPLPENEMDRLSQAEMKLGLGIPREVVLGELGYGEVEAKTG